MKRIPYILMTTLLLLILTACSIQMGYPSDLTSEKTGKPIDPGVSTPADTPKDTNKPQTPATSDKKPDTTTAATTAATTTKAPSTHPYKDETMEVKNPSVIVEQGKTYTQDPPLADITYTVVDPLNKLGLSTEKISHSFGAAKDGKPHQYTVDNQNRFDSYHSGALTWDNKTEEKVLYLTFDCGYEYKNLTSVMLDVLKEKDVPGAFFCTLDYLETAPQIVTRMIKEGHIVGNHSTSHPSDCASLSREKMAWELLGVDNYLRTNFGYECKYFRFPAGVYSQNTLELVYSLGYRSAFWSIAHADWDPENQPGVEKSYQTVTSRLHPGAVILLHTTSPDNAAILSDFIDYARAEGYEFRSLDQYEHWDE